MVKRLDRRQFLLYGSAAFGSSLLLKGCTTAPKPTSEAASGTATEKPIIVGAIYDQTGPLSSLGAGQIACHQMAIDEINATGGLLGRKVESKLYDAQSDVQKAAQLAQQLILQDKVDVLMGCLTSAAREAVRPIVGKYKTLYFYPTQYEGGVCDKYTFCGGVTPSGQLDKLMEFAAKTLNAKKIYTIAADYNYGQLSAAWAKFYGAKYGMEVVAEQYFPLDVSDFSTTITKIQQAKPDAVMSILVGDTHDGFYGQWDSSGMKEKIPVISPTLSMAYDNDGSERLDKAGVYASRSYFQDDPSSGMKEFVKGFGDRYGTNKYLFELGFDCYVVPHMWAQAVQQAGTTDREAVTKILENGMVYNGPQGAVSYDKTHHTNHTVYILKANKNQRFEKVAGAFPDIRATDDQGRCDLIGKPNTFEQFTPKFS
ncbi:MAG TPA: ABC transporter substrate-binding protein [Coleofasciculaceae cyanobacterium]